VATSSLVNRLAGIALLWIWMSATEAQSTPSVVDVLGALRGSGVDVIYSTELVTPSMRLVAPLRSQSTLDRAREALAPYGLILRSIGPDRYVVTRAPPRAGVAPVPLQPPAATAPAQAASELAEISVYASQYTLGASDTGEPKSFSSVDIDRIPGDQDNALRATRLLPGVANNGSSRAYIRGSPLDDVLVEFDGVPLFDPFHMKDFQSLLSAFDTAAIDRMDVYSGGFPVQYGTRSGAVIDITPRSLSSGYECTVGASKLAYEASSVGSADVWPVDWLATVRNSAPEVAERPGNGRTLGAPQFTESVGRVRWHQGVDTAWTLGWLLLDNRTSLATVPTAETSVARYRDEYVWAAFDANVVEGLHSHTMLALTDAGRTRDGFLRLGGIVSGHVGDDRSFSGAQLRNEWTYRLDPQLTVDYGLEAGESSARLRYGRVEHFNQLIVAAFGRPADNSLHAIVAPEEMTYATWASVRRRWAPLEVELGVRFDAQKYEDFAARQQWSPRINVRYDIATRWHVFGSWGHFTQAQRPEEWRVEEAQAAPDLPELAIHSTLGVAYQSSHQTRFGMEVYRKRWTNVSPYYDNTLQKVTLVPDLIPDRLRLAPGDSQSVGVELSAHRAFSAFLEGWANYTWSRVVDDFSGTTVLRSWDQPHALASGLTWSNGPAAVETVVGWHRGWPRTPVTFVPGTRFTPPDILLGTRNSARWGNFFTLDLRSSWTKAFARSDFSLWAEATNSTNRRNPCCDRILASASDLDPAVAQPDSWFPRSFDVGFTWRFHERR
jgi:hypothetical protein